MTERTANPPPGWEIVSLADVAFPSKERAEPVAFKGSRYIGLEHIESGSKRIVGTGDASSVKSTKAVFRSGDVLYGKLRPYLNKVCQPDFDGVCSTDILVFPRTSDLDNQYLLHFLSRPSTAEYATQNASGINLPRISANTLRDIEFPLAPLAEQRRIVSKIEVLHERSRKARDLLAEVGPLLAQFRQSLLATAFRGDLTADWRKQNANVEPASELLSRIRKERRKKWEQAELAKYAAKRKKPPKGWQDKYSVESKIELSDNLPKLPQSWCYARADEIVEPSSVITYGIVQPGPHIEDGVPYIRGKDVENGRILVDQLLRTSRDLHAKHSRSTVNEGDILLCVIRHLKVALVPSGINDMNLTQGTVRLRPSEVIDGAYMANYLASPFGQGWMLRKHFGLAMPRINVADARAVPVPLAPLKEQAEVLRLLEEAMVVWESLWCTTEPMESSLTQLEQSILSKAFRGELVPQDPNDEPASVLLERIRETRAQQKTKIKGKKNRKAAR